MPRAQQLGDAFFCRLRVHIGLNFHRDIADIFIAADLAHQRGVGRVNLQAVGGGFKLVLFFFQHTDYRERAFFQQYHFAQRVFAIGKQLFLRVFINHHHLRVVFHVFRVKQSPQPDFFPAHIKILLAHTRHAGG